MRRLWFAGLAVLVSVLMVSLALSAEARPPRKPRPSPSPTPTQTVTPTPTPTATTASPTPTATSTSTAGGFPDANTTGVPVGTSLTAVSGDMTITTANTVIDSKDINGCVQIRTTGVTIKRSKIHCPSTSSGVALGNFDDVNPGSLIIEDSEIDCKNTNGTAIGDARITATRLNIHGCENGFDLNQTVTVQDSYIHDMYQSSQAHTDGIQLAQGHFTNGQLVAGALDITVRHNRIYANDGTSAMISGNQVGKNKNILIQNNLMAGGAATLYCDLGVGQNFQVIDNRISRIFYPTGGAYMPWTDCQDEPVVSGNVWDDTGDPLPF